MQDRDKELLRQLGWGLLAAAAGLGYAFGRRAYEWRGARANVTGTVAGCVERWDADHGEVYTTSFTYADPSGRGHSGTTQSLRYCLPAGHAIALEYLVRDPDKARPLDRQ